MKICSIVVSIANAKLGKICIEYIGLTVTISRDKCDITKYPSVTIYTHDRPQSDVPFSIRLRYNGNICSIFVNIANTKFGEEKLTQCVSVELWRSLRSNCDAILTDISILSAFSNGHLRGKTRSGKNYDTHLSGDAQ